MNNDNISVEDLLRESLPSDWPEWVVESFVSMECGSGTDVAEYMLSKPADLQTLFAKKSCSLNYGTALNAERRSKSGPAFLGAYVGDVEGALNSPIFRIENGCFCHPITKSLPEELTAVMLRMFEHKQQCISDILKTVMEKSTAERADFLDEYNKALKKQPLPEPQQLATHEKIAAFITMHSDEVEQMKTRSELQDWLAELTGQPDQFNSENVSKFCERHQVGPKAKRGRPKNSQDE
jgi:hypothetical protein